VNELIPSGLAALCLATPASAQITAFQHIILVIQENRTPDNFFQGLCTTPSACSTKPGPAQYNIQIPSAGWLDKTSKTGTTTPEAVPFGLGYDLAHTHRGFRAQCDLKNGACTMDGAANVGCRPRSQSCPTKAAFGYVDEGLEPYLDLVKSYGWANYMFQTNQGNSYPAHLFLFAATSAPSKKEDHLGYFVSDSGKHGSSCASSSRSAAPVINPNGEFYKNVYPCFEYQALSDLLEARPVPISWRYYGVAGDIIRDPGPTGIWTAPASIAHICNASNGKCQGTEWTSHLQFTPSQVLSDISTNCNLAGVSWVIPDALDSDHMGNVEATGGPSWVASIVNAVGQSTCKNPSDGSSYWDSTAIIVTWDDWGGWYDHEQPLIEAFPQGGYQMGFRVPLIFVSAYTPPGFIHNGREDFGSVIRFVEHNFGIQEGALTFADAREGANDFKQFFNLGNAPRKFRPISAPLSAKYFLTRKPSGLPVDDD
jgi:phospholipase C